MNQESILDSIRNEANKYRGHWPEITQRSNLSYSWLIKVMNGSTPNPRIQELQRLATTLIKIRRGKIKLSS